MTTKIEITITENDSIYFIYVYRETTLLHKFEISKYPTTPFEVRCRKNVCSSIAKTIIRVVEKLLVGGD